MLSAVGNKKAPIRRYGSALSYSWVTWYARMICRIRPMSAGLSLAFFRAFSAFFASLALTLASLAAAFGSWAAGFVALVPLLALRDAASAIATHFQLSILCSVGLLDRRCTDCQGFPGVDCLTIQPTGAIGGAYEWSAHHASETDGSCLVG